MATPWSQLKRGWSPDMAKNQDRVLDAIRHGDFIRPDLRSIRIKHPTDPALEAFVRVMSDALKLGVPGDSVRITVSHRTAQAIADLLGMSMPTAKLTDAYDDTAVEKMEPQNWLRTEGAPSSIEAMEADDRSIDAAAGKVVASPGTPWKVWINHQRLAHPENEPHGKATAINYGGFTSKPAVQPPTPGPRPSETGRRNVYQQAGGFHDVDHVDESQKAWFVDPSVVVTWNGVPQVWRIDKLAVHPDLYPLVASVPMMMRHPWLPTCFSLDEGGSCGFEGPGGTAPPSTPKASTRALASGTVIAGAGAILYALRRWL